MHLKQMFYLLTVAFLLIQMSCNGQKQSAKANDSTKEVSIPCSPYYSDDQYFRASRSGESSKLMMAKKQALLNAKTTLAGSIKSRIQSVTKHYSNKKTFKSKKARVKFSREIEKLTRKVVDKKLRNVDIVCNKVIKKEEQDLYQYFVAIEMPASEVVKGIHKQLTSQQKSHPEYDKKQFQKVYNKELKKLDQKHKNAGDQ